MRNFGSDPEFFAYDLNSKSHDSIYELIPPAALIQDFGIPFVMNKNGKRELLNVPPYGTVIEDGAAIELNVTPVNKPLGLVMNINNLLTSFQAHLTNKIKTPSIRIGRLPYAHFNLDKYWKGRDESFHDCVRFGCDPDYHPEIYNQLGLDIPAEEVDASNHTGRYFGMHFHLQNMSDNPNIYVDNIEYAPVVFDFLVGCYNAMYIRPPHIKELELKRLKFYGRPGRIRIQKYSDTVNGIEYRPPSNHWGSDTKVAEGMFTVGNIAANIVEAGLARDFFNTFLMDIPEMWSALTTLNSVSAKRLLDASMKWAVENDILTLKDLTLA